MNLLQLVTDRYQRTARFLPAVLIMLPVCVLAVTAVPVAVSIGSKVAALAAFCLPFLVSQAVRDRGIRVEPALFRAWDGRPSERLLRWRCSSSKAAVARRHQLVSTHLGIHLPNAAAEADDSAEADAAYAVATAALRERARDKARFPLVYDELIAYGFLRNGYACRIPAIVICVLTALLTLALARWSIVPLGWKQQTGLVAFDVVAAAVWWRWFTPDTVRRAAEKYANQLFFLLETLGATPNNEQSPGEQT